MHSFCKKAGHGGDIALALPSISALRKFEERINRIKSLRDRKVDGGALGINIDAVNGIIHWWTYDNNNGSTDQGRIVHDKPHGKIDYHEGTDIEGKFPFTY